VKTIGRKNSPPLALKKILKLRSILIAALLYFGLIVASHYILLKPQFKQYELLEQEKEKLNRIYGSIHPATLDSTVNKLKQKISRTELNRQKFRERTLDSKNLPALLTELNYMAKLQQIELGNISPLPEVKIWNALYQKQFIQVNFKASYTQFLNLLKSFESARYWLLIDALTIRQNNQDFRHHNISLKLFTITKRK